MDSCFRDCVIIDVVAQFIGLLMILSTSLINEAATIVAKNGVMTQSVRRNDGMKKGMTRFIRLRRSGQAE